MNTGSRPESFIGGTLAWAEETSEASETAAATAMALTCKKKVGKKQASVVGQGALSKPDGPPGPLQRSLERGQILSPLGSLVKSSKKRP
jgi:hypothetical protein